MADDTGNSSSVPDYSQTFADIVHFPVLTEVRSRAELTLTGCCDTSQGAVARVIPWCPTLTKERCPFNEKSIEKEMRGKTLIHQCLVADVSGEQLFDPIGCLSIRDDFIEHLPVLLHRAPAICNEDSNQPDTECPDIECRDRGPYIEHDFCHA